jgi:hypothetical protein
MRTAMSEEKKDSIVGTGPDGEPVVLFTNNPVLNEILTEKALEEDVPGVEEALEEVEIEEALTNAGHAPSAMAIRTVTGRTDNVEVAPGVIVSQHLIDAAVGIASPTPVKGAAQWTALSNRVLNEIREDISSSQKFVQEMVDRMRNPGRYDEKYVSYDQMPKPLQRVVAAYIAVNEANKELEEAIKALGQLQAKAA